MGAGASLPVESLTPLCRYGRASGGVTVCAGARLPMVLGHVHSLPQWTYSWRCCSGSVRENDANGKVWDERLVRRHAAGPESRTC